MDFIRIYIYLILQKIYFLFSISDKSLWFLLTLRKAGRYSAPGLSRKPRKNKGPGSIPAATAVQHILLDDDEDDEHEEDCKGDEDDEDDKGWGW